MLDNLRSDAKRYSPYGGWWRNLGFWIGGLYRASSAVHNLRIPILRPVLILLIWILKKPFYLIFHIELPHTVKMGPGILMLHPFDIFIGGRVEIGAGCSIYHDVTIASYSKTACLKIGDGVVIFPGARIIGDISLGEHSEIGANCVITKNIDPYSVVIPPLPRSIPQSLLRKGSRSPDENENR